MPRPTARKPSLAELVAEFEAAVRDRDLARASRLLDEILRSLKSEAARSNSLERRLSAGNRSGATLLKKGRLQRLARAAASRAALERRVRAQWDQLAPSKCAESLDGRGERTRSVTARRDRIVKWSSDLSDVMRGAEAISLSDVMRGAEAIKPAGVVYPVWFGTDRKPTKEGDGFTGERHDRIIRGRVDVFVPKAHRFGETGTPFWRRLIRCDLRDDHLSLKHVEILERAAFFAEISDAMQAARDSGEHPHALLYLHGFNVTFEEAAIRAAQIGWDLKVPGATAFFSWPSRGSVADYPADEASIEASEGSITEFLVDFSRSCGAEKVHVIAHSMGNRGLLRALQRIEANAETRGHVKFGQVFLAAPDVDRNLFLDLASLYLEHAERTTLYASDGDLPVHLSATIHKAPRAGYYTPYTVAPGIDTVAVPDFNVDLLGHTYFAKAGPLLHDIHDLMRHGEAPASRQRIKSAEYEGTIFWELWK